MKVNVNQTPDKKSGKKPNKKQDKKPLSKKTKSKTEQSSASNTEAKAANDGNVYVEGLKAYKDKYSALLHDGAIFRKNKFWIVIAVILFVVFLSINSNMNNTKMYYRLQIKNMTSDTSNLIAATDQVKTDLEEQARINSIKLTDEEEELARNDAKVEGARVADLQNRYQNYDTGSPERQEIKTSLMACFNENSKGPTQWYIVTKNEKGEWSGIPGTWEFVTNASFKGRSSNVLWLCYADNDLLLAYCTANYNVDTKLFTDVEWKMTSYAQANMKSDDEYADAEDNKSMIDKIKELAESGEIEIQSGDFDEDTINRNNELFDNRDAYKQSIADDPELYDDNYNIGINKGSDGDLEDPIESEVTSDENEESTESEMNTESEVSSNE